MSNSLVVWPSEFGKKVFFIQNQICRARSHEVFTGIDPTLDIVAIRGVTHRIKSTSEARKGCNSLDFQDARNVAGAKSIQGDLRHLGIILLEPLQDELTFKSSQCCLASLSDPLYSTQHHFLMRDQSPHSIHGPLSYEKLLFSGRFPSCHSLVIRYCDSHTYRSDRAKCLNPPRSVGGQPSFFYPVSNRADSKPNGARTNEKPPQTQKAALFYSPSKCPARHVELSPSSDQYVSMQAPRHYVQRGAA